MDMCPSRDAERMSDPRQCRLCGNTRNLARYRQGWFCDVNCYIVWASTEIERLRARCEDYRRAEIDIGRWVGLLHRRLIAFQEKEPTK